MRLFSYIAIGFGLTASMAFAGHDGSAGKSAVGEGQGSRVHKHEKPTLAVGATLDENGRLWLAKVENQRVLVSWSDDEGSTFSAPVSVTPEPETILADGENRPTIAVARDGTVLLTWVQSLPQKYSGNVRFARSTDAGKSFSDPITLNDDGRITSHSFAKTAIDGMGRVVVAWLDGRDRDAAKATGEQFKGLSLYTAQSSDNGKTFGPNRRLQVNTCECCRIGLAWGSDGPVVLWRHIFGSNTRDFAVENLDKGGIRRATDDEWQIDACPHNGGSIAIGHHGRLHLAWPTDGTVRQGLFYKYIDEGWDSPPLRIGNPSVQANHASVAALDRTVLLTWREFDGNAYSVKLMHSADAGSTWSESIPLMESAGGSDYPIPLVDAKKVLVVWNTAKDGLRILRMERVAARHSR